MTIYWIYQSTRAYRDVGFGDDIPFYPATTSSGGAVSAAISLHYDVDRGTRAKLLTSSLLSSWNLGLFSGA